jgi:cell wall-associated NlpC family hydrolase
LEAKTVGGQVWDWVELTFMAQSAYLAEQRRAVVAEAQRHVGAHYVWGAAGATPGGQDGMPARAGAVLRVPDRLDARNPCLRAASCSVDGLHVCAGRFQTVGGRVLQPGDAALTRYLDSLRGKPAEQWQPMNGLWPRMMEGKKVTRQIVLGESCIGVRHFDCVGFINYCLSVVLRRSVQNSIEGWINNSPEVRDGSDQPGDILTVGTHHIGFAMGDGRVIHASETARGVVIDSLAGRTWRRGRYLR